MQNIASNIRVRCDKYEARVQNINIETNRMVISSNKQSTKMETW